MLVSAVRLAHDVTPYAVAAVTTHGVAVLTRAPCGGLDAGVSFGHRVLCRLAGRIGEHDPTGEPDSGRAAVVDTVRALAAAPEDVDLVSVLRVAIRRILETDPALATEIAAWPRPAGPTTAGE